MSQAERDELGAWARAQLAKQDLIEFSCRIDPTQTENYRAAHMRKMADSLEAVERGEITRLHITTPPRHWKTSLAIEKFFAYYLARHPDRTVGIFSHSQNKALESSRTIRSTVAFNPLFKSLFPKVSINPSLMSAGEWALAGAFRSSVTALSVGSSPTGRGYSLIGIDDPVADVSTAYSRNEREKQWAWYREVLRDRLEPGGAILLIMCMTGDTPVLMADGTERPLATIKVGDEIATYECGKVESSTVVNWKNQGRDNIFAIRMESGITVKANERHPFLVSRNGDLKWVTLRNLVVGEKMVRVSGVNGSVSSVRLTDAKSLQSAGAVAGLITTKHCGQAGTDLRLSLQKTEEHPDCAIGMELVLNNSNPCSKHREGSVLFVNNSRADRTPVPIGETNFVSTTTTAPERSGRYCATIATSQLDTYKQKNCLGPPLSMCGLTLDRIVEISSAGIEDVFDIQVARTENFIANGLVSHNSRWHQDDLAGRLIRDSKTGVGEKWEVLHLKAINEAGGVLWPERWARKELDLIKQAQGARAFAARFQGEPRLEEGNLLDSTKLIMVGEGDLPKMVQIVRRWDLAFSDTKGADYVAGAKMGLGEDGRIYILHLKQIHGRWTQSKREIVRLAIEDGIAVTCAIECNGTQLGYYQDMQEDAKMGNRKVVGDSPEGSKEMRASVWGSRLEDGLICCVRAPWNGLLFDQMDYFPNGEHDDIVDAVSGGYSILKGGGKGGYSAVEQERDRSNLGPRESGDEGYRGRSAGRGALF